MWRPLEHDIRHVVQIIKCCALLHNVCVHDWLQNRSRTTTKRYVPVPPHHREEDEEELTVPDEMVIERWENHYDGLRERARTSTIRNTITKEIWDSGFRVTEEQCSNHARR